MLEVSKGKGGCGEGVASWGEEQRADTLGKASPAWKACEEGTSRQGQGYFPTEPVKPLRQMGKRIGVCSCSAMLAIDYGSLDPWTIILSCCCTTSPPSYYVANYSSLWKETEGPEILWVEMIGAKVGTGL